MGDVAAAGNLSCRLVAPGLGLFPSHWYALYTYAHHEKRVAAELEHRKIEHFLPLYGSVRRWKDRRVRLDLPLFPGYVFVRLPLQDRSRVVQMAGVARLVGFGGSPAALPDEDMAILRSALGQPGRAAPHAFLVVGRRVRITAGPFAGLQGVLERKKNNVRVVVSLDLIERSLAVDVDAADVAPAACGAGVFAGSRRPGGTPV